MISAKYLLPLILAVFLLSGCSKDGDYPGKPRPDLDAKKTQASKKDSTPPVLQNLGGISSFDIPEVVNQYSRTYFFGQPLPKKSDTDPGRINPNLEFHTTTQTNLVSALDGVVVFIKQQPETNDYEVFLSPVENSTWVIGYDHVADIAVQKGQSIKAGDPLGKSAPANSGGYFYELQINNETEQLMYCPLDLMPQEQKIFWQEKLASYATAFNQKHGPTYPEGSTGCLSPTITVSESEGKN